MKQMLDYSREAIAFMSGKSRKDLDENRLLNLSITRLLEVIGEAATRLTQEERDRYPQVPWKDVIGMRNRLIHGYDKVDFNIVWIIVTKSLPELVKALEQILNNQ